MAKSVVTVLCAGGALLLSTPAPGEGGLEPAPGQTLSRAQLVERFLQDNPRTHIYEWAGRISRVYGKAFSTGITPQASAEQFRVNHAGMFGVPAEDLVPRGPFHDGHHLQPIMYDRETGQYKFTGVYYQQQRGGAPVFGTKMVALTKNVPGNPVVLVSADVRDLGEFAVNPAALGPIDSAAHQRTVLAVDPGLVEFTEAQYVIWAGVDDMVVEPRLAVTFIGDSGIDTWDRIKWLYVIDAATGDILYRENQILEVDVVGNVSALATELAGAEQCEAEVSTPMPYARVEIGGSSAFADVNGDYTVDTGAGFPPFTVDSPVRGLYFFVTNLGGADTVLSQPVTPPGPADFLHNSGNTEFTRGEVNAYIQANAVRDWALNVNPAYPTINSQTDFSITVNEPPGGFCPGNAQYQGDNLRFCAASVAASRPNTAWSSVVYHEYGHHLVAMGGSGQGAYGEGMSDVTSNLITGESGIGFGFFGDGTCGTPLRDADNTCEFQSPGCSTCGSQFHACGNLISGCVWSTRAELMVTEPFAFHVIITDLALNSILLHSGSSITPSITIDYLTLDGDDGDIGNGTPHYTEINAGFSAHNMPAPPLALLAITFPDGQPAFLNPSGGDIMRVEISSLSASPQSGTGMLHVDTGAGFVASAMTEITPNVYDAEFPPSTCGTDVRFYVSAETTGAATVTSPSDAPVSSYKALSGAGLGAVAFADDFEADLGWTVSSTASDGQWDRGVPAGGGDRGDPPTDADGSSQCYLTDNVDGNSDVDGGSTTLTSPNMDASGGPALISYYRWYDNTFGSAPEQDIFVIEVSDNGGASWVNLETVGPSSGSANPEVSGGWFQKQFALASIPGFNELTTQFRIRFIAEDAGTPSVVEAGVDGVELVEVDCGAPCPTDVNGDGATDVLDLIDLLLCFGLPATPPCDEGQDINQDGDVDVLDLIDLLLEFGASCP